jgi:hypothetical protein
LPLRKRAFGEFAGAGRARAEFERAREQQVQHHRAAVRVQFEHVLAGGRVRSGEEQYQRVIEEAAAGVAQAHSLIVLGAAVFPVSARAIARARGPETRTMPIAPAPDAVAIAAIVSVGWAICFREFACAMAARQVLALLSAFCRRCVMTHCCSSDSAPLTVQ